MRSHRTHGLVTRFIGVALVVLLAVTSCGISSDTEPQRLDTEAIPESLRPGRLPTPTPVGEAGGEFQTLYMVGPNDRLFEVFREVPAEPDAVVESLFFGTTPTEERQGIGTAITRSTALAESIEINPLFLLATVTLDPDSLQTNSRDQLLGFGQIVFTLTELEGIESVLFQTIRGDVVESLRVQTDKGLSQAGTQVRRADYASIDPATNLIAFPDDDAAVLPPPTATPDTPLGPLVDVPIWLLNADNELVAVTRQAERTGTALVNVLFDGLTVVEEEAQLRSAIRVTAELLDLNIVDGTAVVDLSADSLPAFEAGDDRVLAVAQIVFTLTGLAEVDAVVFTINDVLTPMPTQDGISSTVIEDQPGLQRFDYQIYAPDIAIVQPTPTPTPTVDPDATATVEPTPTPEA